MGDVSFIEKFTEWWRDHVPDFVNKILVVFGLLAIGYKVGVYVSVQEHKIELMKIEFEKNLEFIKMENNLKEINNKVERDNLRLEVDLKLMKGSKSE
ncbi:hypothetical protein [Myroides odoratimimus]|uniref:hypothetical protein n=1 Tax=Myroides odoratimimus TaxID=76832 RepID=UPI00046A0B93|nr:hypothetical protein [Myroides odoratimimus]